MKSWVQVTGILCATFIAFLCVCEKAMNRQQKKSAVSKEDIETALKNVIYSATRDTDEEDLA